MLSTHNSRYEICRSQQQYWKYYSGNEIENNEMGGACSTYEARRGSYKVLVGKPERKNQLEDQGVDGTVILRWNFTK